MNHHKKLFSVKESIDLVNVGGHVICAVICSLLLLHKVQGTCDQLNSKQTTPATAHHVTASRLPPPPPSPPFVPLSVRVS